MENDGLEIGGTLLNPFPGSRLGQRNHGKAAVSDTRNQETILKQSVLCRIRKKARLGSSSEDRVKRLHDREGAALLVSGQTLNLLHCGENPLMNRIF